MNESSEAIWIQWQVGGLRNRPTPEVGQHAMIHEHYLYDDDGNTIGTAWLDKPIPGIVTAIDEHWSNQPEGRSGYWVLLEPADHDKLFAIDKATGNIVYRIPGKRHGDGQIDSDDNPVWLLADESDLPEGISVEDLPPAG